VTLSCILISRHDHVLSFISFYFTVTTPCNLVPSKNNSRRGFNLLSTLYMRSTSWYGFFSLIFLSLNFLAKCPYLSHNRHSLLVFSPLFLCPNLEFVPSIDCSTHSAIESTINQDIYKCVPWYQVQFRSQCIKQSINQFSNTQRSITTDGYDELLWTSISC